MTQRYSDPPADDSALFGPLADDSALLSRTSFFFALSHQSMNLLAVGHALFR